jgi:hypothetical protein
MLNLALLRSVNGPFLSPSIPDSILLANATKVPRKASLSYDKERWQLDARL